MMNILCLSSWFLLCKTIIFHCIHIIIFYVSDKNNYTYKYLTSRKNNFMLLYILYVINPLSCNINQTKLNYFKDFKATKI